MKVSTKLVVSKFVKDLSASKMDVADLQAKFHAICAKECYDEPAFLCYDATNITTDIDFDTENCSGEVAYISEVSGREKLLLGYNKINGFSFYGFNAGGDWEHPVYSILYMEAGDDKVYMYTPRRGNTYNPLYDSAYGNNDDSEEGEDTACDYDLIMDDIKIAFNLDKKELTEEESDAVTDIVDSIDELVEAVSALSDETVEEILRDGMKTIVTKVTDLLKNSTAASDLATTKAKLAGTESMLADAKKKIDDLEVEAVKLNKEIVSLKKAAATPVSTDADKALDEIAKIISSVKAGAGIPTASAVPTAPAPVPAAPAKPLKKISLPSKSISFKYFYGVELDCGRAILHIVKEDDWARDELAKEGRVDTETVARLKKELPMKREMFVYVLDGSFDTVDAVVEAVTEASSKAAVNLTHSKDVQAKL